MDSSLKLKYQKCKFKVKSWEDKFMAKNKRLPLKDDIKNAESAVRQAYKYYYLLKTKLSSTCENVGDSTVLNGDTTQVKNSDIPVAEAEANVHKEELTSDLKNSDNSGDKVESDPVFTKVRTSLEAIFTAPLITKPKREVIPVFSNGGQHLKELTSRLSALQNKISTSTENDKDFDITSTESDKVDDTTEVIENKETESAPNDEPSATNDETFNLPKNVKNAWGAHLNKSNIQNNASGVKKLRERTSSFHFTQKLFSSSLKFKTKRNPLKPHVPLRRSKSECFSFFNESSCDSSISQDTNSQTTTISTQEPEVETEQPEPVSTETSSTLQLFSSTKCKVTVKDSTQVKATFQTVSKLKSDSRHSLDVGWLNRCTKPVENPLVDIFASEEPQVRTPVMTKSTTKESVEVQLPVQTPEPSVSQQTNVASFKSDSTLCESQATVHSDVDLFSDNDDDVVSDSDTEKPQKSFLLNRLPKRTSSEALSPMPVMRKKPKVEEKPVTVKSVKQEQLEKKISEGRVNENFVKINIKKKIFVRGRKNTSYSKYKKMMYKKKQAGDGERSTRVKGGCFTCGEAGHWANNCPQKVGLMPLEEAEQLDDSPYLTLEEAGALAEENKPISKFTPLPQPESEETTAEVSTSSTIHNLPPGNCIMPVYPRPDDGSTLIDTPLEVWQALKQFGHKSFRPGQEEAIMRILSGMSTLVMLSTGAGKSLCYQLPAYLFAKRNEACITLVVSPLVSLMEDQVNNLPGPLLGACLHTNQTPKQRAEVEQQLKEGKLHVLLVSPEAVVNSDRMGGLGGLFRFLPPIAFVCIDEAHCVSQWSHNFRPSYLMICKVLRERLKVNTILGLTATATKATALNIAKSLNVPDDRIISDMPMPDNLILSISRDANRDQALIKLLQGPRFSACESIIIYCIRREECERVAGLLRTCLQNPEKRESSKKRALSWNAEAYHAGLTPFRRKQVQQHFMAGKVRIVVATVAFGMGINKNDLRAVIHYNMPASFERFVQEVGRAGRDGLPAHCHLFLDSKGQDLNELRRHIYSDSVDRHAIRKLLLRVFKPCSCLSAVAALEKWDPVDVQANAGPSSPEKSGPVTCPGHEVAFMTEETVQALDLPEENILTLLCYLEHHRSNWVELLPSAYVLCKVASYGGAGALKAAAKKCPPLAMAVALDQKAGISHEKSTSIEFKVVDVASAIGWDSGQAKRQLKELEWTKVNDKPQRSKISVQLSGPGLRVRAKGCLPPEDLDEALDWLAKRVEWQEKSKLLQLEALFLALTSVSYSTCDECIEDVDLERCDKLRGAVKEYFNGEEDRDEEPKLLPGVSNEDQIRADVSAMFGTFSDTNFTGRAIARIFHGISSPCYPPYIWGRTKFWRLHLNDNFNSLCRIATKEILRLRL